MSFVGFGSAEIFSGDDERADALKLFMKCQTGRDFDISRALLKTSESEPARRLSGHKTGKKPRNMIVFLFSFSSRKGKFAVFLSRKSAGIFKRQVFRSALKGNGRKCCHHKGWN